jgi:Type VI immunity for VRR-NUC
MSEMKALSRKGEIVARDNFIIAFFARGPFKEMAAGVRSALEQWLAVVPPEKLEWALLGMSATKYKKLTPEVLKRCFEMLEKDVTSKTDVFFKVFGPETAGPDYLALVKGYAKLTRSPGIDKTNVVEFLFPAEFPSLVGHDVVVDLAAAMFDAVPCDSGYASPALHFGIPRVYEGAARFIAPLALQHHGYDVPNNAGTSSWLGSRCRGARWLTMLSSASIELAGGLKHLQRQLAPGVSVRACSRGVLIRAGSEPELGSVNQGERTPLLASVARAVEPITLFEDMSILPLFDDDEDRRDRWERRFWWDQE